MILDDILDSIGKSSHKKKSFKKFYKIVKDKFVIKNIRKNENLRKMFKENITKFQPQIYILFYTFCDTFPFLPTIKRFRRYGAHPIIKRRIYTISEITW